MPFENLKVSGQDSAESSHSLPDEQFSDSETESTASQTAGNLQDDPDHLPMLSRISSRTSVSTTSLQSELVSLFDLLNSEFQHYHAWAHRRNISMKDFTDFFFFLDSGEGRIERSDDLLHYRGDLSRDQANFVKTRWWLDGIHRVVPFVEARWSEDSIEDEYEDENAFEGMGLLFGEES